VIIPLRERRASRGFRPFRPLVSSRKGGCVIEQVPGWHIWRSDAGRWWATRLVSEGADRGHEARWAMTVDADTADELRAELKLQDELR
jgi:hypothetical protein